MYEDEVPIYDKQSRPEFIREVFDWAYEYTPAQRAAISFIKSDFSAQEILDEIPNVNPKDYIYMEDFMEVFYELYQYERCKEKNNKSFRCFLRAKHPYQTWFVQIEYQKGERPDAFINDLEEAGYTTDWATPLSMPDEMESFDMLKRGTDIFCGWTREELRDNLTELIAILDRHGQRNVQFDFLTLADCM
jgi:hypothetical protein